MLYYKNWRKDKELWENIILPVVEDRIGKVWSYSNEEEEDLPDEVEEIKAKPKPLSDLISDED